MLKQREKLSVLPVRIEVADPRLTSSFSGKYMWKKLLGGTNNPNNTVTLTECVSANALDKKKAAPSAITVMVAAFLFFFFNKRLQIHTKR